MKKFLFPILFISLFVSTAQSAPPLKAQKLYEEGLWRKAALEMDQYLSKNPDDLEALLFRVKIALSERDLPVAEKWVNRAKNDEFPTPEVLYYQAAVAREKGRPGLKYLKDAETLFPEWYKIHLLKSWFYVGLGKLKEAALAAEKAQEWGPEKGDVYSLLGYIYFRKGEVTKSKKAFKKSLELDPDQPPSHAYLGQGLGESNNNDKLKKEALHWKKLQEALKLHGQGQYKKALSLYKGLLKVYPGNVTLHFLSGEALKMWGLARHRIQYYPSFQKLAGYFFSPAVDEKIYSQFFKNYSRLSSQERRVLAYSAAPFGKYLPTLIRRNNYHYILPMERRISEIPGMAYLHQSYARDGRRKGDVRGISALNTVTGQEAIQKAGIFEFNTLAHELAHQVHISTLSRSQKRAIRGLYQRALKEKRCLDYYAATNDREYFAQGYEAFISRYKRTGLGLTSRHTREELRRRDPELYDFLKKTCSEPLSRCQLAEMYYHVGRLYQNTGEKRKSRRAFEKATYLALGMVDRD